MSDAQSAMANPKRLKVALVCDWLTGTGGAERVVLELHHLYPEAPIYTSQYNRNPKIWYGDKWFEDADVRTGWLQKLPKRLKKFLPLLRAIYFSRLKLDAYDLVISSSGAEAKYIKKLRDGAMHITYCHSPAHYYWQRYNEYQASPGFGLLNPLARLGLKVLSGPLRRWDYKAAQRPNYFVANSRHTQSQIQKYYGRESTIIHPPVEVDRFSSHNQPAEKRHGLITAGRQTPYKRIDLAVAAATELNLPMIVVGTGPEHRRLKKMAGASVTFLSQVGDQRMAELFGGAKGFIFPTNVEDFGITGVEAMAAGTPVIAYRQGGPADYIKPGKTGLFFDKQSTASLVAAITKFNKINFNHATIAASAKQFEPAKFRTGFEQFVDKVIK